VSVYKRPGQETYSFDFRHRGQRFSGATGCTTRREAERFEEAERDRVKARARASAGPMSFRHAADRYGAEVGQHHSNSDDTVRALAWLEAEIGAATPLSAIDDDLVAKLVARRRGEHVPDQRPARARRKAPRPPKLVSNATVNRTVTAPLRSLLRRARKLWRQEVQEIDWTAHMLPEPQERVREASRGEEAALDAAVRADYAPALRFAFLNGCRRGEVIGLTWQKVDFFSREFTVTGKRDRSRTIPMTDETYELLWSLKDDHPTAVFTYRVRRPRQGQVKGARQPITDSGFKTEWRRARARAGVTDFRFHDTRHTAATRLMRATGNLKMAQQLLGHTEIATTARYAHVQKEDLRAGMATAHARARAAKEGKN
jgi:integrase